MFNALVAYVQGTGVLWHLAPVSARDSIQANGILPGTHSDTVWLYVDKDYTPSDYDLVRSVEGSDGHYTYRTSLDLWAVQATPEVLASMQLDTHLQDVAPYAAVVVPCVSLPATLHTPCHRRAGSSTRDPINRPVSAYKESINQTYLTKEGKEMSTVPNNNDGIKVSLDPRVTVQLMVWEETGVMHPLSYFDREDLELEELQAWAELNKAEEGKEMKEQTLIVWSDTDGKSGEYVVCKQKYSSWLEEVNHPGSVLRTTKVITVVTDKVCECSLHSEF
jgi:hypothetical protein